MKNLKSLLHDFVFAAATLSCILILTNCGGGKSIQLQPNGGLNPKGAHTSSNSPYCRNTNSILSKVGIDQAKLGLDQVVTSLAPSDVKNLILGAKIYRRATPSKLSSTIIRNGSQSAVASLERAGKTMQSLGLVTHAPKFDLSSGTMSQLNMSYPLPRADRDPNSTPLRDLYDGVATYGIGVGQNTADAGFVITAQVMTKVAGVWYETKLEYTGVTAKYILSLSALNVNGSTSLDLSSCIDSAQIDSWTQMPRDQKNMNECESKACPHLPTN